MSRDPRSPRILSKFCANHEYFEQTCAYSAIYVATCRIMRLHLQWTGTTVSFKIHKDILQSLYIELTDIPVEHQDGTDWPAVLDVIVNEAAKGKLVTKYADILANLTAAVSMGIEVDVTGSPRHWHGGPRKKGPRIVGDGANTVLYRAGVFLKKNGLLGGIEEADWLRFASEENAVDPAGVARHRAYLTNAFHAARGFAAPITQEMQANDGN